MVNYVSFAPLKMGFNIVYSFILNSHIFLEIRADTVLDYRIK